MADSAFNQYSWKNSKHTIYVNNNRVTKALQTFYDTLKLSGHFAHSPTFASNEYTKTIYDISARIPVSDGRVEHRAGVRPTIALNDVPRRYLDFWTAANSVTSDEQVYPACGLDIPILEYVPRLKPYFFDLPTMVDYAANSNWTSRPNRFWEITLTLNTSYPFGFNARYIGDENAFLSEFGECVSLAGYDIYSGIPGQTQNRIYRFLRFQNGSHENIGTFTDTFIPVKLQKTGGLYDDIFIPYMRSINSMSSSGTIYELSVMISSGYMFCGLQYVMDSDIHFIYAAQADGDFANNPFASMNSGDIGALSDMPYRHFQGAFSTFIATKSIWEDIFTGSGMLWSYDDDIIVSPDDGGLNKPDISGQPENPTDDSPGTGDNTSDDVDYPAPSYIPNATVYDRYFLTPNQVPDVKKFLFSDTFVDNIKRLWTNPAEYVISLVCYPFDVNSTGLTTTTGVVSVGGVASDMSAAALTDKGVPYFYGGSVYVDKYYNSYLDYEPYTSIDIFIPYIGVRPLNVSQIVGHTLNIGYYVDLNTQQITALLGLDGSADNLGQVVTQFVGSIGVQTPLSGTSAQDMIRNVVTQTSGLITGVGAIAGGVMGANPVLISSGVAGVGNSLLGGGHTAPSYYGSLSPVSGLYTPQTAYLIINRPRQAMPTAYLNQQGFSSNYSGAVSSFSGYLECASVNLPSTTTMTAEENQEIINTMIGGFYI